MKEFLKKYWSQIVLIVIIVGIIIYSSINISGKNGQIYYQDSLKQIDSMRYSQVALEYKTEKQANEDLKRENKALYDIVNQNKEQIRSLSQLVLKLETKTYTRIDTISVPFLVHGDTVQVPLGQDSVKFAEENSIIKVYGSTFLYPHKGYTLTLEGKEFPIDLLVTEGKDGEFHSYVDTHNPDLKLMKLNTKVLRYQKGFWDKVNFLLGANILKSNLTLVPQIFGGISYNQFGVSGILQLHDGLGYGVGIYKFW